MLKNIIFDLGGVLYNLSFKASFDAFKKLGIANIEELFTQHHASPVFENIETGKITPAEFYVALREVMQLPIKDEDLRDAYNAMLLGFRKKSLEYLSELSKTHNVFLLSNTNAIHHDFFTDEIKREFQIENLDVYFQKAWYSHTIGLRKPYEETYAFVLNDANLIASETLFIDDTPSNLPAPQALGIHTHLLLPAETIEDILPKYLS